MLRGGWKQREAAALTRRERSRSRRRRVAVHGRSAQASGILLDWAMGRISAPAVRRTMRNAVRDAADLGNSVHDMVLRLSKLGGGKTPLEHSR